MANNRHGKRFVAFLPAVSKKAGKRMRLSVRRWRLHLRNDLALEGRCHCGRWRRYRQLPPSPGSAGPAKTASSYHLPYRCVQRALAGQRPSPACDVAILCCRPRLAVDGIAANNRTNVLILQLRWAGEVGRALVHRLPIRRCRRNRPRPQRTPAVPSADPDHELQRRLRGHRCSPCSRRNRGAVCSQGPRYGRRGKCALNTAHTHALVTKTNCVRVFESVSGEVSS